MIISATKFSLLILIGQHLPTDIGCLVDSGTLEFDFLAFNAVGSWPHFRHNLGIKWRAKRDFY